jgi:hypothetical protein
MNGRIRSKSGFSKIRGLKDIGGALLLMALIAALFMIFNGRERAVQALSPTPAPTSLRQSVESQGSAPGGTRPTSGAQGGGDYGRSGGDYGRPGGGSANMGAGGSNSGSGAGAGRGGSNRPSMMQGVYQGEYGVTEGIPIPVTFPGGYLLKDSIGFEYQDELRALHQDLQFMMRSEKLKLTGAQKMKLILLLNGMLKKVKAIEAQQSGMDKVFNKSQRLLILNNPYNGYYYIPSLSAETDRGRKITEEEILNRAIAILDRKSAR